MIYLGLPGIPPSTNKAYANKRGGGRILSAEGRKYKRETTNYVARHYPEELKYLRPNTAFTLIVLLEFGDRDDLFNKGFPNEAENKFKKLDVTNRVKLLEDALSDATAVDDACNWQVDVSKRVGAHDFTHIWAVEADDAGNYMYGYVTYLLSTAQPK